MDVNIYVDSTIKNPNRGEGTAMFLLECETQKGPKTLQGFVHLPDTTEDSIILTALIEGLGHFLKETPIRIFVKAPGVFNAIDTGRIQTAKLNGFRTAKGQSIKNAELWSILLSLLPKHKWTITNEEHSYQNYMKSELKKWHSQ